jgi:hypothetical protein
MQRNHQLTRRRRESENAPRDMCMYKSEYGEHRRVTIIKYGDWREIRTFSDSVIIRVPAQHRIRLDAFFAVRFITTEEFADRAS